MPISLTGTVAVLNGYVDIADAEALHPWLIAHPGVPVDVSGCEGAHTGIVQLLVAAGNPIECTEQVADWRIMLQHPYSFHAT